MIYILMILLIVLLLLSFYLNKKDLIAPSFIFCASFCFSCVWAMIYAEKWSLELHSNTFWVIFGGVLEFILISLLVQSFFTLYKGKKYMKEETKLTKIKIEKWKKILFLGYEFFTILYTFYFIVRITNGSFNRIGETINAYNQIVKFTDEVVSLPKLLIYSRHAVNAAGYWFAYVLINNYLVEKKIDVLSLSIVITSMISNMTTGGRGSAVNLILGCVAIFCLLMNKKSGFYKSIRFKTLMRFIIIAVIAVLLFQTTGTLLGRVATSTKSVNALGLFDYLAVYFGAEIKNLDLFLQENYTISEIWGSQTFIYIIRWLGPKFGLENTYYQLTLPFRYINGFALGNVATTFYPYIYDFGYMGVVYLVGLMAFLTQWIYERCKRIKLNSKPKRCILIYSFIFSSIVLSFFSNKFYEQNFNMQFIIILIFWIIFDNFFCKLKFVNNRGDKI